jgi:hypothetical protein
MLTTSTIPHRPSAARAARAAAVLLAAVAAAACGRAEASDLDVLTSRAGVPALHRQYGERVALGEGHARGYVLLDGERPVEVGVALDERAMDGLPAHGAHAGAHGNFTEYLVPLPERKPTPFTFVELDWNPGGHGAPHAQPHFDFHFYTIPQAERDRIVPDDPQYLAKAGRDPEAASVPKAFANPAALLKLPLEAVAVPKMGMHWIDLTSPEYQQALGKPEAYRDFTKTFIYGAWDGKFIFMEPMITREYIVAKRTATEPSVRDEWVPIATSPSYPAGDFRPDAYRVTYDPQAREYRIALGRLPTAP